MKGLTTWVKAHPAIVFRVCLLVVISPGCMVAAGEKKLKVPSTAPVPAVELLWPDGAPGAKGDSDGDKPTLTVYLPHKNIASGTAVIICPGGGYGGLAIGKEGHEVAHWLNHNGVAGFVLRYRHRGDGYGHPAPMQDAQRAIRIVRSRAKEWNLKPNRIGILGFSAGGHLASTAGTHFDNGNQSAADPIERVGCRPDFMILIYPVISMYEPIVNIGSRNNLLGEKPSAQLLEYLSNEKQVTSRTPPTFIIHGTNDTTVCVENSIEFYLALRKARVPAEMHIYDGVGHSFGLNRTQKGPVLTWPDRCIEWMLARKLLVRKIR